MRENTTRASTVPVRNVAGVKFAGFIAALQRTAPYVVVWLALVLVVGLTPLDAAWHGADFGFLQNGLHLGASTVPDRDLAIVDLDVTATATSGELRRREIGLVDAINAALGYGKRTSHAKATSACERAAEHLGPRSAVSEDADSRPIALTFDVAFTASTSRLAPECVAPLVAELRDLRAAGVKIYAAQELESENGGGSITGRLEIDPNFEANEDASIYAQITRSGHTLITSDPYLPGGQLFYYPKVLMIPPATNSGGGAIGSCALPIVAVGRADDVCLPIVAQGEDREDDDEVVTVGPTAAFHARVRTYDAAVADAAAFANRVVVVGDEAIDTAPGDPRSKFEILAWAVSQSLAEFRGRPVPRVVLDYSVMLAIAFFGAALAIGTFFTTLTLGRRSRARFAIATLASVGLPCATYAVIDWALATHRVLYSQLAFPVFVVLTTAGVSLWSAIAAFRRDLFVTQLQAHETSVSQKYDVFISYARTPENTKWVEDNVLAPLSKVRGPGGKPLRIFFDRQSIKIGYAWYTTLVEAVYGSRYFVPIYSEGYFDRPFCRDEMDMAMLRQVGADAFILPVARVASDIPTRYARVQFVDANLDPRFIDALIATIAPAEAAALR